MDPGQRVTWHVRIDGHHAVPPRIVDGVFRGGTGWVEAVECTRTGTVWSVATSATSWWVVPDDEPANAVVIRQAGKSYRHGWPEGTLYQSRECEGWRDGIRRAENVRRRGVFPVVESEYASRSWSGPGTTWQNVVWHTDPGCPRAAGKARYDGTGCAHGTTGPDYATWTAASIADVMVGRMQLSSPGPFCATCIMLEPATDPAQAA